MHIARLNSPATTAHRPHCMPVALPRLDNEPPLVVVRRRVRVPRELPSRDWDASFPAFSSSFLPFLLLIVPAMNSTTSFPPLSSFFLLFVPFHPDVFACLSLLFFLILTSPRLPPLRQSRLSSCSASPTGCFVRFSRTSRFGHVPRHDRHRHHPGLEDRLAGFHAIDSALKRSSLPNTSHWYRISPAPTRKVHRKRVYTELEREELWLSLSLFRRELSIAVKLRAR